MFIIWGRKSFFKHLGYYGKKETCSRCGSMLAPAIIKQSNWGHLWYIPILPLGSEYISACPICNRSIQLPKHEFENIRDMYGLAEGQAFEYIANYYKSTKKYDFIIMDIVTNTQYVVAKGIKKSAVKKIMKSKALSCKLIQYKETEV